MQHAECDEVRRFVAYDRSKIGQKLSHVSEHERVEYLFNILMLLMGWGPSFGTMWE
jgi:hypothetical protein